MWKGAKTGLERGQERVWNGVKNGLERGAKTGFKRHKKRNLARFNNLERRGTAVLRRSTSFQPFFVVPTLFSPVFDDFCQNREKRSSKNRGTGKERKALFPVSFPFLFFPFPFQEHLYCEPTDFCKAETISNQRTMEPTRQR